MKKFKLSFNKYFVLASLALAGVIGFAFTEDFFRISKNLEIFSALFRDINLYYVDEVKPGELMKTGIDAMLNSLDPYTDYIPETEIEDFRFMTTGQYGGIGATIRKSGDYVVIAEPYEGFPANKNDLRAGDKILEVDGKSIKGKSTDDVSKMLKGQPGTEVKILIERPQEPNKILKTIKREEIKINAVPYYGLLENGIAYIYLAQFTESASREIKAAYEELKKDNEIKGIILDLRGNPGGLLIEAVNVCNFFVDKGEEIVSTRGRVKDWDKSYKALNNPIARDIPVAVLVNSGSASASEIVSGAIQDLDRGIVIGQRTFGKGLVQNTRSISYNSKLKLTTAKYYIPSGRCIQAIDYSNRNEDGSVGRIPDSLAKCFKTRNGRTVKDGGGIEPDIRLPAKKLSKISQSLLNKNLIFDFATQYRIQNPTIPEPSSFSLSEKDFNDFVDFIKDKDYHYTTKTEDLLNEFKRVCKEEKYFALASSKLEELEKKLFEDKKDDIIKNKTEIMELLTQEIVTRYYFQKGRIKNSLARDKEVKKALEILSDKEKYKRLLESGANLYPSEEDKNQN